MQETNYNIETVGDVLNLIDTKISQTEREAKLYAENGKDDIAKNLEQRAYALTMLKYEIEQQTTPVDWS
jgi:hypothetical protein